MPYSPFTRFLVVVLVGLIALGLLWPDDRTYLWIGYSAGVLAILAGIFTWSVVRSAAPFDDGAFHRCLPPGDGAVFVRVIWIHLLVLAGVSLVVIASCWIANFGWRAMSYGIAMFTLPAWALMSAVGIAASAATSRLHWKSIAWFAIFAAPIFSSVLLYLSLEGMEPLDKNRVYLSPVRTVVLSAAGIYPLIWWLVAVYRRRGLGLGLGAATGALLPWLYIYGDFFKVPNPTGDLPTQTDGIMITRKARPEGAGRWIPLKDLFSVSGVPEGYETGVSLVAWREGDGKEDRDYMLLAGIRGDGKDAGDRSRQLSYAGFLNDGGSPVWGPDVTIMALRRQMPALETLDPWHPGPGLPGPISLMDPSYPLAPDELATGWKDFRPTVNEKFWSMPWSVFVGPPHRWKLLGSCLASGKETFRLESGGRIQVFPLSHKADGSYEIPVREYEESLWQADGPWFGDEALRYHPHLTQLALVLVDETGKHGYLADWLSSNGSEKVMFGWCHKQALGLGHPGTPEEVRKIEAIKNWRVCLFVVEQTGPFREMILPPP